MMPPPSRTPAVGHFRLDGLRVVRAVVALRAGAARVVRAGAAVVRAGAARVALRVAGRRLVASALRAGDARRAGVAAGRGLLARRAAGLRAAEARRRRG